MNEKSFFTQRLALVTGTESAARYDVEIAEDMNAIVALDTKQSLFIDHRNPNVVKMLGEIKFNT